MSNSNDFNLIETGQFDDSDNEEIDFSTPTDITSSLASELQNYYLKQNLQLFAVNLDYLIENADLLAARNEQNHFVCYGDYTYYSPQNLDYDFTAIKPLIQYKNKLETAIITYKNKTMSFYLSKNILTNIPEIAAKSYTLSNPNNLCPIGISNPVFGININNETNKLVPLMLLHVDEIFEFEETQFHKKVDTSKQFYGIPIIVN